MKEGIQYLFICVSEEPEALFSDQNKNCEINDEEMSVLQAIPTAL